MTTRETRSEAKSAAAHQGAQSVPVMSDKARRMLKHLTPAQRVAIREARWGDSLGGYFLGLAVRLDVRSRLMEMGVLGKCSHVLTTVGRELRNALLEGSRP